MTEQKDTSCTYGTTAESPRSASTASTTLTTDWQSYDLGQFTDEHYVLLRDVVKNSLIVNYPLRGIALEFGVGSGLSTSMIAAHIPVVGFDSFQGLPEDWREGFPKGSFAYDPPEIENTKMVVGMFEDTLPRFHWEGLRRITLVHIDCDLYSSTKAILDNIPPRLLRGAYICFDEWHGYEGCEEHEQRAWREFAERTGIRWTVYGHSFQQWAIRIV